MICEACGHDNPAGAQFCANKDCQTFLAWGEVESEPGSAGPGPAKPGERGPQAGTTDGTTGAAVPAQPAQTVEPPLAKPAVRPTGPKPKRPPLGYEFIRERPTPVMVQPLEEVEPQVPAGQAASHGKHGLWFGLDKSEIAVAAGAEATVSAQVLNKGTVVEGIDMRVLGVPKDWVRIDPPRVNMDVGGQAVMTIHISPPKESSTPSGSADVEVALWSSSDPQVRCAQHLRVDVGAFHELEIDPGAHGLTTRRKGEFMIAFRNKGNYPMGVGVHPDLRSGAEGKVQLRFQPRSVAIPPGEAASLKVQARTTKLLVTGAPETHAIQLSLLAGGQAKSVDLDLVQQPLLAAWTPKVLRILAVILVATLGVAAFSWWKNRPHAIPNVVGEQAALAQAQLGAAGFKSVQTSAADPKAPQGVVLSQNPGAGSHRHHGALVSITVSSGRPQPAPPAQSQTPPTQAGSG